MAMTTLDYATAPKAMSVEYLDRQIGAMRRRQRLVWLRHRAARLRVLSAERAARSTGGA